MAPYKFITYLLTYTANQYINVRQKVDRELANLAYRT